MSRGKKRSQTGGRARSQWSTDGAPDKKRVLSIAERLSHLKLGYEEASQRVGAALTPEQTDQARKTGELDANDLSELIQDDLRYLHDTGETITRLCAQLGIDCDEFMAGATHGIEVKERDVMNVKGEVVSDGQHRTGMSR